MPTYTIPPDAVSAYAETFQRTLGDLTTHDNYVGSAQRQLDNERNAWSKNGGLEAFAGLLSHGRRELTPGELLKRKFQGREHRAAKERARVAPFEQALAAAQAKRDEVRGQLGNLADKLIEAAIDFGVSDTSALSVFRHTWKGSDLYWASALADNIAARALLSMRRDNLPAAASRALACLADLSTVEADWWRLKVSPPSSPHAPTYGSHGRITEEHAERTAEYLRDLAKLERRRDGVRDELRRLADPLMELATRPEIDGRPAELRNLITSWHPHTPSDPDRVCAARNFLADLSSKLHDPAVAAVVARLGEGVLETEALVADASAGTDGEAVPDLPALSENAALVYEMLLELAPYRALTAPQIVEKLMHDHKVNIDETTFYKRILVELKAYGIESRKRIGYRIRPSRRPRA